MDLQTILVAIFVILLAIITAVMLLGARAKARLRRDYPPPGKLVDIGGYHLHIQCQGEGGPVVVMDAGQGETSLSWEYIQSEVARYARVCAYDRAGLGWSDPSPKPRTAGVMVEELRTLLERAGIPGPYILVGASLGGLNTRVYAYKYPHEVAGLVLVDAAHEEQYSPEPLQQAIQKMSKLMPVMMSFMTIIVKTGIAALNPGMLPASSAKMPEQAAKVDKALRVRDAKTIQASKAELSDVMLSHAQVRDMHISSLGDLPLVVIRHGKIQAQMMPEVTEVMEETNQRLQAEVAGQSTSGRLVVAEESGHAIQYDQPEVVIRAIQEVLAAVREQGIAAQYPKDDRRMNMVDARPGGN